jgi:hypothetical protein
LWFVGIAYYVGDAGEGCQVFRGALGIAASDNDGGGGFGGVNFADGLAGLGVGGCGDRTGVENDHVDQGRRRRGYPVESWRSMAALASRWRDTGLFDVEGGHCGQ